MDMDVSGLCACACTGMCMYCPRIHMKENMKEHMLLRMHISMRRRRVDDGGWRADRQIVT